MTAVAEQQSHPQVLDSKVRAREKMVAHQSHRKPKCKRKVNREEGNSPHPKNDGDRNHRTSARKLEGDGEKKQSKKRLQEEGRSRSPAKERNSTRKLKAEEEGGKRSKRHMNEGGDKAEGRSNRKLQGEEGERKKSKRNMKTEDKETPAESSTDKQRRSSRNLQREEGGKKRSVRSMDSATAKSEHLSPQKLNDDQDGGERKKSNRSLSASRKSADRPSQQSIYPTPPTAPEKGTQNKAAKAVSFRLTEKDLKWEKEQQHKIDFLKDDHQDMTYARRLALRLMDKKWYNPRAGEKDSTDDTINESAALLEEGSHGRYIPSFTKVERPSLERAWAYFEHFTLARYIVEPKPDAPKKSLCVRMMRKMQKADKKLERAEPGENDFPTKLYSPIFTPLKQMGDFGLGVGLYFSTLRAITILTFIAGLINIPNLIYFSGDDYSESQIGLSTLLKGSAICTNQHWVPCPDCNPSDFPQERFASTTTMDSTGSNVTLSFALRNDCDGATLQQGMVNFGTLIFIMLGIIAMNMYQKHMLIKYDEDEQTAQDYSVIITNPPPDATDPEEWRFFFMENFEGARATTCTVAVDNDFLVQTLAERRECIRKIEMLVEPGTSMDILNIARIAAKIERERSVFGWIKAFVIRGIPELFGRLTVLTARVQGLAQQDYPATNVFVSFETEAAQRRVLSALSVGSIAANRNITKVMSETPDYLFRDEFVLNIAEPEEPSTVRWQDLNARFESKFKWLLTTTAFTVGMIVGIAYMIRALHNLEAVWAALAIAAFNGIFPEIAKILTSLEVHDSEGSKQTSLYFKIAVFRWTITAILITIVTPFTQTLDDDPGLIRSIYAIFFADIVTTNGYQLLDPLGHLRRHFLAPRATTQDLMNINMRGQEFELAERYTNMTKILFLAMWYCSIYPAALFISSFALFINFFMDRFSLMRTWKRAPALGTSISRFSRKYFFSSALIFMAVASSYYWSGFPYDNLCEVESANAAIYNGTWMLPGKSHNATFVVGSEPTYKYCFQDLLRTSGRSFPPLPKFQPEGGEWMTQDQETVTTIFGWTSVAVLVIVVVVFVWGWIDWCKGLFHGTYEPNGEDQGINFSDVPSISTYIPQVTSKVFAYPLLACDIDNFDKELVDWTDPDHPHSYYDLTKDADEVLRGMDVSGKRVFSTVRHWPPPQKKSKRVSMHQRYSSKNLLQ